MQEQSDSLPSVQPAYKDFLSNFPATQLPQKQYSLEADIVTGWKPKLRMVGPIPFNFDSTIVDEVVEQLTSFGRKYKERVIFLGWRYANSFKMHQQMLRHYPFKHEAAINTNFMHMAAYFRKFHTNFKCRHSRIFRGMNPTIKAGEECTFDSNFQSGNLDAVVRSKDGEYDLFMRVDTNTRGHVAWFNFTVRNCGRKKIHINIVNFRKAKTLYDRGLRPYVYSQHLRQTKGMGWGQGGEAVKYYRRKLPYEFLDDNYHEQSMTYNCLSFDYTFDVDWEVVQFAYAPPYTYTDVMDLIRRLQIESNLASGEPILKQQALCESLGGLQVPLLTITDPTVLDKNKKCILISARIHPGETCGSFMAEGILRHICSESEQAVYLRRHVVFKVVPMLNVDGVVVGNYRTSFCGQDLNRTFKSSIDLLIPEVRCVKELVVRLRHQFKSRLIFFLDLHGHSVKKNVFLYGPEYQIWQSNYYKTRIFPKILSRETDMFRYYSCLFRIADFKRTTARAILLKHIPHCYTIEASTGFYYSAEEKRDMAFTGEKWMGMGHAIAQSVKLYLDLLYDEELTRVERKQKMMELKTGKNRSHSNRHNPKLQHRVQLRVPTVHAPKTQEESPKRADDFAHLSQKARDLIDDIKKEEKERDQHEEHESDRFSEGGSDSQSLGNDLPEQQLKDLQGDIAECLQQFQSKFMGKSDRQFSVKQTPPKIESHIKIKKEPKVIQLIASLRKKGETNAQTKDNLMWPRIKEDLRGSRRIDQIQTHHASIKATNIKMRSRKTFGLALGLSETQLQGIKHQSQNRANRK